VAGPHAGKPADRRHATDRATCAWRFTKLARGLFMVLAVLIALPLVGIDITVLSVFGGALGVGLGLGLQKIAANYVSGFTLLLDQSIRIGDMVQVDKHYGEVKEIATRYTVLRSLDGSESIIPNETMITFRRWSINSLTDKDNQILLPVQVAYGSNLDRVREVLLEIAVANVRVLRYPRLRFVSNPSATAASTWNWWSGSAIRKRGNPIYAPT
jgi:small-conductance mechanosensitive channel